MKTIKKHLKTSLYIAFLATAITACKKDDDPVATPQTATHEEEVITTLTLTFTDSANVQPTVTATFRDPDGDGGNGPDKHDTIKLANGTTYNVAITLLNESETPAEDMTAEIKDEDDEHLVCMTVTGANVSIVKTDTDGTLPVGLESKWTTGAASNGTVQVTLKHQPGVKDGTCAPGDTDIDVTYVTQIN